MNSLSHQNLNLNCRGFEIFVSQFVKLKMHSNIHGRKNENGWANKRMKFSNLYQV